jgi:DNA-binding MarR family transcriptional regulator
MLSSMIDDLRANEVASALQSSIGLFMRRLRQSPAQGELTVPEASALSRLERGGPATASDLARAERITPQGMSMTLAALEERGLVARRQDPSDGRRMLLSVTKAGREAMRSRRSAKAEQLAKVLAGGFSGAEVETLREAAALIERLAESL